VALAAWTPPQLVAPGSRTLHAWQLVPFWSYYRRSDVYALADLINQVLAFLPLGVLLAIRFPRLPAWCALAVGLAIGLVLEAGQLGLADRTAEITDALSAGAGSFLGVLLWRRCVALRTSSEGHARYRIASYSS
jgi:glycopeptide antibiotics resistance protein